IHAVMVDGLLIVPATLHNPVLTLQTLILAAAKGIHMPSQRTNFRIEQMLPFAQPGGALTAPLGSHEQSHVLAELQALRGLIVQPTDAEAPEVQETDDGARFTQLREAAVAIDNATDTLTASVQRADARALAHDIEQQVVHLFETCDVPDLSGQRIGA